MTAYFIMNVEIFGERVAPRRVGLVVRNVDDIVEVIIGICQRHDGVQAAEQARWRCKGLKSSRFNREEDSRRLPRHPSEIVGILTTELADEIGWDTLECRSELVRG